MASFSLKNKAMGLLFIGGAEYNQNICADIYKTRFYEEWMHEKTENVTPRSGCCLYRSASCRVRICRGIFSE